MSRGSPHVEQISAMMLIHIMIDENYLRFSTARTAEISWLNRQNYRSDTHAQFAQAVICTRCVPALHIPNSLILYAGSLLRLLLVK